MGWTPDEVGRCSFWKFKAAWLGWAKSKGIKTQAPAPSDEDFDEAIRKFGGDQDE